MVFITKPSLFLSGAKENSRWLNISYSLRKSKKKAAIALGIDFPEFLPKDLLNYSNVIT